MARSAQVSVEQDFKLGLVTEVTGVNSPENSVVETKNMVYDRRGRAYRRPGFNLEVGAQGNVPLAPNSRLGFPTTYVWQTSAGFGSVTFVVVHAGTRCHFYRQRDGFPLSSGREGFVYDIVSNIVPGWDTTTLLDNPVTFSTGQGRLIVTHPACNPVVITYNDTSSTFSTRVINIETRDFEGVEDGLVINQRPGDPLSALHRYNLYNQGWSSPTKIDLNAFAVAIDAWRWDGVAGRGDWPSNADVWWYYKGTGLNDLFDKPVLDVFTHTAIDKVDIGNTPAPKGHFIYNAFQTSRNSFVSGVPETTSNGRRPSVCAFFSGRAFYAGVRTTPFNSRIYYSQIIEKEDDFGKCYQKNDPTSELFKDLLQTDGGVIDIQEIDQIVYMSQFGPSLFVFATNGIWSVSGSDRLGFSATEYMVQKITDTPVLSQTSITAIRGVPVWWNNDGIYTLQGDQGKIDAVSLTNTTIQSFFDEIPTSGKMAAKGLYLDREGLIYWLYRNNVSSSPDQNFWYDAVLVYNTETKAFYTYDLSSEGGSPWHILGGVVVEDRNGLKDFFFWTVAVTSGAFSNSTWSQEFEGVFNDMSIPFDSHFITGYRIRGSLINKFQTNYLLTFMEHDPDSSCYVQAVWDYVQNTDGGKMSSPQQVYSMSVFASKYHKSKRKMRGQGRSLQFKFFSEGSKPFTLIGWAGFDTANQIP